MTDTVEYTGEDNGHQYTVGAEPCKELCEEYNFTGMEYIVKRYPRIRNIYYGWNDVDSDRPPFKVHNPMRVLTDVWNNINELDTGEYLVAADSKRILDIYVRRWLTKKNNFHVLSGGYLNTCPYVVVQKTA